MKVSLYLSIDLFKYSVDFFFISHHSARQCFKGLVGDNADLFIDITHIVY